MLRTALEGVCCSLVIVALAACGRGTVVERGTGAGDDAGAAGDEGAADAAGAAGDDGTTGNTGGTGGEDSVATGGGAFVATGGEAFVATGGGTVGGTGGASVVASGGGTAVATGGGTGVATGGSTAVATGGASGVGTGGAAIVGGGGGAVIVEPQDDASTIFQEDVIRTYEVTLAEEDLARIDANPAAEQYVPAQLQFEGQSYDVGYRYKGSTAAFMPPCMARGKKAGKCSVKISFDWTDPEVRFYGVKKLLFHSMNADASFLRERLAHALFREMGVPASRAVHARLVVNGVEEGLFALVEDIDGRFTRARFPDGGEGNLYKEIWPI